MNIFALGKKITKLQKHQQELVWGAWDLMNGWVILELLIVMIGEAIDK